MEAHNEKTIKNNTPCLVVIRIESSVYQAMVNAIVKCKSVIRNYGGQYVCSTHDGVVVEGATEKELSFAFLRFETYQQAVMWLDSGHGIHQFDWCGDSDIVFVPLDDDISPGDQTLLVADVHVYNSHEHSRNLESVRGKFKTFADAGAKCCVHTSAVTAARGKWGSSKMVVFRFDNPEQFAAYQESEDFQKMKEVRDCTSTSVMWLCQCVGPSHCHHDHHKME